MNQPVLDAVNLISQVAAKYNLTLPEIAFRWLNHHSQLRLGKDGILIGVSSIQQLHSNIDATQKGALPQEVVNVLDEAWVCVKATSADYWHLDLKYTYDTEAALFK
jgi:aflatoxin B1 aldehyde reductase